MMELKLCGSHARVNCAACRTTPEPILRACADCEAYAVLETMTRKADGRMVCRQCESRIQSRERDKAQASLFVQQDSLFGA